MFPLCYVYYTCFPFVLIIYSSSLLFYSGKYAEEKLPSHLHDQSGQDGKFQIRYGGFCVAVYSWFITLNSFVFSCLLSNYVLID